MSSMCRQDLSFADTLYSLAQTSPTIQKLIDQAASNILALKKALGALAPPLPSARAREWGLLDSADLRMTLFLLPGLFDNPYGSMTNPNIPTVGSNAGTCPPFFCATSHAGQSLTRFILQTGSLPFK